MNLTTAHTFAGINRGGNGTVSIATRCRDVFLHRGQIDEGELHGQRRTDLQTCKTSCAKENVTRDSTVSF
jgi:hypothetical protein